jgi:hypothetical protein
MYIGATVRGETKTITSAANSFQNCDFEDITGAGAASWDLSAITGLSGDCGGNSGITFTTPATMYWYNDAGSYSDASNWFLATNGGGGAGRVPLPQDAARWDANSFSVGPGQVVTVDMIRLANIDTTGVSNTPAFSLTLNAEYYGDFILENLTVTSTSLQTFQGRGSFVIDTNGISIDKQMGIDCIDGDYQLLSAFTLGVSRAFNVDSGSFVTNDFAMDVGSFGSSGTKTRSIDLGDSEITIRVSGTCMGFNTVTGLTLDAGTSNFAIDISNATARTIQMGGLSFYEITKSNTGTGTLDFTGGGTIYNLKSTDSSHTFRFTAGTTTTWGSVWDVWESGTHTITSITAAAHSMSSGFGGAAQGSGTLTISYMTGVQANIFYAGTGSTNGGNNTQVYFTDAPVVTGPPVGTLMLMGVGA